VGAAGDDSSGSNTGAAYVFARSGSSWAFEARLLANDATAGSTFGQSLAISGTSIVVGGAGGSAVQDAAYVFTRGTAPSGGIVWTQQQRIALTGGANVDFGFAVAIFGDQLAVGQPLGTGAGLVNVYTRSGGVWTQSAQLSAADRDPDERFGDAIDMDATRIVVGAPNWDGVNNNRNDQGRAFVFEGAGATWTRVARLTADGGLAEAEARANGFAGDRFGASVALSGNYVAVGTPGYDGTANDVGAAYVFMQLPDQGSGNGASWVRATGATGDGRLGAQTPAGSSTDITGRYNTADTFGSSVAIAGSRLVVGMPGHNDVQGGTLLRPDVGGVRTFATNGILPAATNASLWAEQTIDPLNPDATTSRFGSVTHYDAASRSLFVGDAGDNRVYVYINEGLYWRLAQVIQGSTASFGHDIDVDGGWMVVGAPQSDRAYMYKRDANGETWTAYQTLAPNVGGIQWGASVAISGNRLVIGMPGASASYQSAGQATPGHSLQLGAAGGAFTYRFGGTWWDPDKLLMPNDAALPDDTSYEQDVLLAGVVTTSGGPFRTHNASVTTYTGATVRTSDITFGVSGTIGAHVVMAFADVSVPGDGDTDGGKYIGSGFIYNNGAGDLTTGYTLSTRGQDTVRDDRVALSSAWSTQLHVEQPVPQQRRQGLRGDGRGPLLGRDHRQRQHGPLHEPDADQVRHGQHRQEHHGAAHRAAYRRHDLGHRRHRMGQCLHLHQQHRQRDVRDGRG
jgi:hypothetical protein